MKTLGKTYVSNVSFARLQIEPVRLLEAQMACLRQAFEDWLDMEPEEPESDRPTEEELAEFENAEKAHQKRFEVMEHQAARLSASLGVGKLSGKISSKALYGFVREGVRFAFSTDEQDEDPPVGERLAFLRVLSKYLSWVKRDKSIRQALIQDFNQRETDLRNDPGFEQVFDEDKEALGIFRKAGDLGEFPGAESQTVASYEEHTHPVTSGSKGPRLSMGSSISSIRSKTTLSPLYEEAGSDKEDEASPSPDSHQKIASTSPNFSVSTGVHTRGTMADEESSMGSASH